MKCLLVNSSIEIAIQYNVRIDGSSDSALIYGRTTNECRLGRCKRKENSKFNRFSVMIAISGLDCYSEARVQIAH